MKAYEYVSESFSSTAEEASEEISDRSNALGRHGWKLVTATVYETQCEYRTVLTFRRRCYAPNITKSILSETRGMNELREGSLCTLSDVH
jgi:hypothetical protein